MSITVSAHAVRFNTSTHVSDLTSSEGASLIGFTPSGLITGTTVQDVVSLLGGTNGAAAIGYTPTGLTTATNIQSAIDQVGAFNSHIEKASTTVTSGQTVVTVPFTYTPGTGTLLVFINGILQNSGYTETNSTTVTFDTSLPNGSVGFVMISTQNIGVTSAANVNISNPPNSANISLQTYVSDLYSTTEGSGIDLVGGAIKRVSSFSNLMSLSPTSITKSLGVMVDSYYGDGGKGNGLFQWNSTSTATEDLGTVVCPTTSTTLVTSENIFTGNGSTATFTGTLLHNPIRPGTVTFTAGSVVGTDNTAGIISGSGIVTGNINYTTGVWSITYSSAPANLLSASASYRYSSTSGRWIRLLNKQISSSFYGVKSDGVTDDTQAVARWLTLSPDGLSLFLEAGACKVNSLILNRRRLIDGAGESNSYFIPGSGLTSSDYILSVVKDSLTPSSSLNLFNQITGISLSNFGIRDSRITACNGIKIAGVDEMTVRNLNVFGLNGTAYNIDNSAPVRECDFYNMKSFFCGNSSSPAWIINSPNVASGKDAHNELRFYSPKSVYGYGTGVLIDCVGGTGADGLRDFFWINGHIEGIVIDIGGSLTSVLADNMIVNQSNYNLWLIGGTMGQNNGYSAGVSVGYACVRLGNQALGQRVQGFGVIGGYYGDYSSPNTGGCGFVLDSVTVFSLNDQVYFGACPGGALVYGKVAGNSNTITAPSPTPTIYVSPSVYFNSQVINPSSATGAVLTTNFGADLRLSRTDVDTAYITRPNTTGTKKIALSTDGGACRIRTCVNSKHGESVMSKFLSLLNATEVDNMSHVFNLWKVSYIEEASKNLTISKS